MHRNAITEMKSRLERLESLVSLSRSKLADHDHGAPFLTVYGDKEPSFYLTDRMGFSNFIGKSFYFLLFSKKPAGLLTSAVLSRICVWFFTSIPPRLTEGFRSHWIDGIVHFISNRARIYMLGWSEEMMSACQQLAPDHVTSIPSKESAILTINCQTPGLSYTYDQ